MTEIKKIPVDLPGCRRIEVSCGKKTVEISQLGPKDLNGPGDIGIMPTPITLSRRQVVNLLKTAAPNRLIKAALKALDAGTADFYGSNPSRSVLHELDLMHAR